MTVGGRDVEFERRGTFARLPRTALGDSREATLSYDLPEKETEELMPSGRCYRFKWRGDEIVGIDPQEEGVPFYPATVRDEKSQAPV